MKEDAFIVESEASFRISFEVSLWREETDGRFRNVVGCSPQLLQDSIYVFNVPFDWTLTRNLGLNSSKAAQSSSIWLSRFGSEIG